MLRVTPVTDEISSYSLRVEGRLAGTPSIRLMREELAQAERLGRPVVLELSGLRYIDEQAIGVLAAAVERGVRLTGCSPWLASLLGGLA